MKCLNCKYVVIEEYGYKGLLGESLISCGMCNEIDSDMNDCEDFEDKNGAVGWWNNEEIR